MGEAAYPYTGHSGQVCIPRRKGDPPAVNTFLADGIRGAVRAAGFTTPVVTVRQDRDLRGGRGHPCGRPRRPVGMARALLADPDLPRKWLAGRDEELRACVFCPFCEEEDQRHRVVTCTLWPKGPSGPQAPPDAGGLEWPRGLGLRDRFRQRRSLSSNVIPYALP